MLLVVTPLAPDHRVSKETQRSIKRNDIPLSWVSFKSSGNCAANAMGGIEAFAKESGFVPPLFFLLDNNVICGRHMFDRMFETLSTTADHIGYCYCNFQFKGEINRKFDAVPFDAYKLLQSNYISSNSMIKTQALSNVGWLVTDDKYKRLLDWCLWLKFLTKGYMGVPCPKASFTDISHKDSVSSGDIDDYKIKHERVQKDFVEKIIAQARIEQAKIEKLAEMNTDVIKIM